MEDSFVSLQEVASLIGKSVQTVRRMVKKGELTAERMKTPQGFQYVVKTADLPREWTNPQAEITEETVEEIEAKEPEHEPEEEVVSMLSSSTIHPTSQHPIEPVLEPSNEVLINQTEILTSQNIEPTIQIAKESESLTGQNLFDKRHDEIMSLITILERLQAELDKERRRPRTLFAHIMDWLHGRN